MPEEKILIGFAIIKKAQDRVDHWLCPALFREYAAAHFIGSYYATG